MCRLSLLVVLLLSLFPLSGVEAQGSALSTVATVPVSDVVLQGDTIPLVLLPELEVYARRRRSKPLTPEERQALWRRIRDVKITLPYAKYVASTLMETYEYMETLPTEKMRREHLKRVQRDLKEEMEPKMRKLTLRQGKLLIKLINRQCGETSYELVKAVMGSFKAWWWNTFAHFVGANLKDKYDPVEDSDDAVTERIIQLVDEGRL